MKNNLWRFFFVLALLAGFAPGARAAVVFTVTPAAVSNTYNGTITLLVTGLTNTETVVVQDYLDANTNGVIDGGDILWQQFQLTDGQQSVFHDGASPVTNFNVPGDTDGTANGAITAKYVFQVNSPQTIAGQYAFRLFSPSGHFTPVTNLFAVTNFPCAQAFTGSVLSNGTSTTLANAIVLLFNASSGNMNLAGGAVANNAGSYLIKAPPGTYTLAAVKSNYVADLTPAANLMLGIGATINTNLNLLSATQSISGRVVDANNSSLGIAGFLLPLQTQGGLLTLAFTDTNGNFTAGVAAGQWKLEGNEQGLMPYGYLGLQNSTHVDTTGGSVSGVTIAVPKATAVFYGRVQDNLNHPLAGISLHSQQQDNNYQYQSQGVTDTNGNYVAGTLAGMWGVGVNTDSSPTNYVFSQGAGTTLTNGQACLQNFTAILATNHITGNVQFGGTNLPGVQISAFANIGGLDYQAQGYTDTNGNYLLNVPNGNWSVSPSCNGGNGTLDSILGSGNYVCPNNASVTINNNNGTANFIVAGTATTPDVVLYYVTKQKSFFQTAAATVVPDTSSGPFNAYLGVIQSALGLVTNANVTLPTTAGRGFPAGSTAMELQIRESFTNQTTFDTVYPAGSYTFNLFTLDNGNQFPVLTLPPPVYPSTPQISNYPAAQTINPNAAFALQWNAYSGGTTNDTIWCFILDTNGAQVFSSPYPGTDFANSLKGTATSVSIPSGTLQSGRSYTGVLEFFRNTSINTNGYPGALGATFVCSETAFVLATLSPAPLAGQPTRLSPAQFGFTLGGVPGSNYTVLTTTNVALPMSNWFTLLVTNLPAPSVFIQDNQATNQQRFYRIKAGP